MGRILVGTSKLILGVALALLMLSMAGVATARYFMARLSVLPPRPTFANDIPVASAPQSPPAEAVPSAAEAPEPLPEPEPTAVTPNGYQAVVVQPIGLVLRSGPGTSYSQVGGVDYDTELTVLEDDPAQGWLRVQVTSNGQEGWIKAGNTRRL